MAKYKVGTALNVDKIIEFLDGYNKDGITMKYIEKSGMYLIFEVEGISGQEGIDYIKHAIRSNDWAKALYFSVMAG